ncbi:hypothetical protein SBA2_980008 [Acidobacteriia bacterium SbA2]|nr:hypothetical protein SBA2_980008 [Acidobacteriia bacterium SbA2]
MTRCCECKAVEEKRKFLLEMVDGCCPWWAPDHKDDMAFRSLVVLFAALMEGTNVENLTVLTGYPPEFVAGISLLASNAGLRINGRVHYDNWFEGDRLEPYCIFCDLLVLEGRLTRQKCEDGKIRYKAVQPC